MNFDGMHLDRQLRAALSQEAEMQNAPEPDVERLIVRGKVRQRHRSMVRTGAIAAVAVLIAGGVYGLTRVDSGTSSGPVPADTPVQPYRATGAAIRPGTYRMLVGWGKGDHAIHDDITFARGWQAGTYPVVSDDTGNYGGMAVYEPLALAAGSGCLSDAPNTFVLPSPQKLAGQLSALPHSTVLQPPTPVTAFGHHAFHVRLRIDQHCGKSIYRIADTVRGAHDISYGNTSKDVVIDFWVMGVGGRMPAQGLVPPSKLPVVVETWHQVGASGQMLNEIASTRDSIKLLTGE